MPISKYEEIVPPPAPSSLAKAPIKAHPVRKATTMVNRHPVAGTVHP